MTKKVLLSTFINSKGRCLGSSEFELKQFSVATHNVARILSRKILRDRRSFREAENYKLVTNVHMEL